MAHQPRTDPPEGPQNIIIRSETIWPAPPAAHSQEWQKKHAPPLPRTPPPSRNHSIIARSPNPCAGKCGDDLRRCEAVSLAYFVILIVLPLITAMGLCLYAAVAQ